MSDYKIVKDASGSLICYGPNTHDYEPTLKNGETLTIETAVQAEELIKDLEEKNKAALEAKAEARRELLDKLGITSEEAQLLLGY